MLCYFTTASISSQIKFYHNRVSELFACRQHVTKTWTNAIEYVRYGRRRFVPRQFKVVLGVVAQEADESQYGNYPQKHDKHGRHEVAAGWKQINFDVTEKHHDIKEI